MMMSTILSIDLDPESRQHVCAFTHTHSWPCVVYTRFDVCALAPHGAAIVAHPGPDSIDGAQQIWISNTHTHTTQEIPVDFWQGMLKKPLTTKDDEVIVYWVEEWTFSVRTFFMPSIRAYVCVR